MLLSVLFDPASLAGTAIYVARYRRGLLDTILRQTGQRDWGNINKLHRGIIKIFVRVQLTSQ